MKLTPKEKAKLKALANPLKASFSIGKEEPGEGYFKMLGEALEAHELVKVSINQNSNEEKEAVAELLEERLDCAIVQIIGRTIVIYRPSRKHPRNLI